jgi:hypothetical protein
MASSDWVVGRPAQSFVFASIISQKIHPAILGLKKYATHKQVLPSLQTSYLYIHMIRYIQIIKDCCYNFQAVVLLIYIENLVTQAMKQLISLFPG